MRKDYLQSNNGITPYLSPYQNFSAFAAGQEKTQSGTTGKTIVFEYDAAGNRIARKTKDNSAVISNKNAKEETSDSRPAQEESREENSGQ